LKERLKLLRLEKAANKNRNNPAIYDLASLTTDNVFSFSIFLYSEISPKPARKCEFKHKVTKCTKTCSLAGLRRSIYYMTLWH